MKVQAIPLSSDLVPIQVLISLVPPSGRGIRPVNDARASS
jgi:hypothetical protein